MASPAASPGCPAGTFLGGSLITLTAAPEPNWTVTGWSGTSDDGATTLTNTLTMPATDHVAGVTYAQCYALTLSHTGEGGDPIASPAASAGCGMGEFVPGTLITLTASPAFDWSIFGWLGTNDDSSTAEENSLTMPATNHQVAVFYTQCHLLALSHNGEGADPSAEPGNSAGCPAGRYLHETSITLTAAPAAGWTLVGWMGSDDDGLKTLTNMLTMPPTSHQVHVDYAQCYSLTLSHTGSGADPVAEPGSSPGCTAGYYLAGTVIGLTAAPEQGWRVSGWNGSDDDEAESVYNQLTMPAADHIVTVIYSDRQYIFLPLIVRK